MLFHGLYWLFARLQDFDPAAIELIPSDGTFKTVYFLGMVLVCLVLPSLLGVYLAKRLRMKEHGWKLALIFTTVTFGAEVVGRVSVDDLGRTLALRPWTVTEQRFDLKLGVDLKGGVILIYEVDQDAPLPGQEEGDGSGDEGDFTMGALVEALSRRINPTGTKEIVIRPYGERQVEIIIPEVDQREVEQIKKGISTAGVLQFRIVANPRDHAEIIELAQEMAEDRLQRRGQFVRTPEGEAVGFWARVAREQGEPGTIRPFKLPVATDVLRDASTGELITVEGEARGYDAAQFADYIAKGGIKEIDILMSVEDPYNVTGAHLGRVGRSVDEYLRPCITFNLKGEGIDRFTGLTREYSPDGQFQRQLGIILDNELLSAPNIEETIAGSGRITGQFTDEEVAFLVNILQAGSLPVVLNKTPISENLINPLLGRETIEQGKWAIGISLAFVLVFILFYYRFAGMVACFALVANLLFILALMIMIKAAFTLPGLAGLVLTVGMSVDANVLIFERIREELSRGSALRMAIRNGFSRATTTIVDANVTTLITAIVLYGIGTDQIRGFAVTLILGILMSMFTAIFCSRVVFDIAERARWVNKLSMIRMLGATQIDFLGMRRIAGVASLLVIAIGVAGIATRGTDIFDIDFNGGTSVHLMLDEAVETETIRDRLEKKLADSRFTLTAMNAAGGSANTIFKVDSALPEVEQLQQSIREAFAGDSQLRLATYSLQYGDLRPVSFAVPVTPPDESGAGAGRSEPEPGASSPQGTATAEDQATSEGTAAPPGEAEPDPGQGADLVPQPAGTQLAFADEVAEALAQAETAEETADPEPAQTEGEGAAPAPQSPPSDTAAEIATETEMADLAATAQFEVNLTFGYAINGQTLTAEIEEATDQLQVPISYFELDRPGWDRESSNAYTDWTLRVSGDREQVTQLLDHLKSEFSETPVWPSSSKIGGQVAGRMQNKAIAALLTSLLGIVIYIWIRFQRVAFGLAAVLALVHDVLITLGAIAVSAWLAGGLGFLLIEEFKISLPIVAALLTIIGYSLNDTIVIFDRIREVRGKSPELTSAMINTSINQTLSRTLLTSLTTLLVVGVLYAIGGQGIHGFAFALVVGVVAGTYSTIFIASPALLWMTARGKSGGRRSAAA